MRKIFVRLTSYRYQYVHSQGDIVTHTHLLAKALTDQWRQHFRYTAKFLIFIAAAKLIYAKENTLTHTCVGIQEGLTQTHTHTDASMKIFTQLRFKT